MQVRLITLLFACLLVVGSVAVVGQADADVRITNVSFGGPGAVNTTTDTNKTYLWQSDPARASTTIHNDGPGGVHRYCVNARKVVSAEDEQLGNRSELGCQVTALKPNSTTNVTFERLSAPRNATGRYRLSFVLQSQPNGGEVVANNSTTVWYITKSGDVDGDGLINVHEVSNNTSIDTADTDSDGLDDGPEIQNHGTDPRSVDTDGDGLRDSLEVSLGTNPRQSIWPVLLGVAALFVLVVVGAAYRYGAFSSLGGPGSRPGTGEGRTARRGDDGGTDTSDGGAAATAAPDTVVTDEDRILQLLAENDGRLMQSELVDQTGWSKSKVSRRLSALEEEGQVSKISLGRQNIVTLPGHEPEGTKSPLDE
ncbi:helix-turn-helix domain-containing protein [Halobium salinum]|uniref:Helix-turn-helix domain-containing protein n=1 Tax=Halobium salinum TaxID=1364940 RepID=A0ABD5PG27_9EURY|nr:helix-turn-helix domain-containing protein [Halobium salinum]